MAKRRRWGTGSVYQRAGDRRWVAAVSDGSRHRVRYAETRKKAEALLAELRREVAAGQRPVDRQTTVGNLLIGWLNERHGRVSPTSWHRYESQVRLGLAGVASIRATALAPDDIRTHLRTISPAAGRSALRILRAALTLAVRDGTLERNVAEGVAPPRSAVREGVVLTDAELVRFYAVAYGTEHYALWTVLVGSGLRMGEALGLRWTDLDIPGRRLTVTGAIRHQDRRSRGTGLRLQRQEPKTAAGRRIVPMTLRSVTALLSLPQDAIYVFHRGHGRPLNPSTVQRAFASLVAVAGLPAMRLHDIRHTWVSRLVAKGVPLDTVKRWAGHSSVRVTADTYAHLVWEGAAGIVDEAVG